MKKVTILATFILLLQNAFAQNNSCKKILYGIDACHDEIEEYINYDTDTLFSFTCFKDGIAADFVMIKSGRKTSAKYVENYTDSICTYKKMDNKYLPELKALFNRFKAWEVLQHDSAGMYIRRLPAGIDADSAGALTFRHNLCDGTAFVKYGNKTHSLEFHWYNIPVLNKADMVSTNFFNDLILFARKIKKH